MMARLVIIVNKLIIFRTSYYTPSEVTTLHPLYMVGCLQVDAVTQLETGYLLFQTT